MVSVQWLLKLVGSNVGTIYITRIGALTSEARKVTRNMASMLQYGNKRAMLEQVLSVKE